MSELIPVEQAAKELGVTPKLLRGRIMRNNLTDPIGDLHFVYDDWRLRAVKPPEDFSAVPSDREDAND